MLRKQLRNIIKRIEDYWVAITLAESGFSDDARKILRKKKQKSIRKRKKSRQRPRLRL